MAVTAKMYGLAHKSAWNKEIDFDSDTIKAVLCDTGYTPNQDTHQYASSLADECADASYSRKTLASKAVSYDGASNTLKLDAADFGWTALTETFRYLVYVDTQTGSDATSPLIAYVDFGSQQTATAQDVNITLDADGLVTVTVA
jgi:hypothetical protein